MHLGRVGLLSIRFRRAPAPHHVGRVAATDSEMEEEAAVTLEALTESELGPRRSSLFI